MKQKIHIPFHPDSYRDEPSLRVAEPFGKLKTGFEKSSTHFQIPKLLNSRILLILLFPLWGLGGYAQQTQPYEWKWAMSGGSSKGGLSDEAIHDIKVGSDGNYYFIASIFGTGQHNNAQLDGVTIPTNNTPSGPEDIFLFSTDCEGEVRWSQAIGGGSSDSAYNLVLDSEDNVYIGGYFSPGVTNSAGTFPVRFSATDSLPTNSNDPDYHKKIYLVKYDKNGNYEGKKALQGNVQGALDSGVLILDLAISNDTLHFVVGLLSGTHLDNQVTVPSQYVYDPSTSSHNYQYHLAKYDTNLDYVNSIALPISLSNGNGLPRPVRFAYDETTSTYYMAGEKGDAILMSYDGQAIVNWSYIIAIDGNDGSKKWVREIYTDPGNGSLSNNWITSLAVDEESNVYIGGRITRIYNDNTGKIYDPSGTYTYPFVPTPHTGLPTVIKLNNNGIVQWMKYPMDFAPSYLGNTPLNPKGLALNGNEIGFGSEESYFIWDGFPQNYLPNHKPDPTLLRFDKQSGTLLGMHRIPGFYDEVQYMTAVATDHDGNYITGGSFRVNLFMNNNLGINPLTSTGESDFFVAKLANSECGSGLSTNKFNSLKVNVYPNPTTDIINIETDEKIVGYFIYNEATQKLQAKTQTTNGVQQLNLEGFPAGTYFIALKAESGNVANVTVVKK